MRRYRIVLLLVGAGIASLVCSSRSHAQVRIEADAIAGQPFGVGRISLQATLGSRLGEPGTESVELRERSGRAFYPAYGTPPGRQLLRELISAPPRRFEVYFLFQGNEPLDLTLYTPSPMARQLVPRQDQAGHARLLAAWWREYSASGRRNGAGDFPPTVNAYLTAMLGRRLGLDTATARPESEKPSATESAIGLLLGTESMQVALQKQMWLESVDRRERADQPLPTIAAERLSNIPEPAADVAIEPIALRVPAECFYMRFGNFNNFQWYRERTDGWGGDLRNIVSQRAIDYALLAKIERQLALKESALSKIFGSQVIADVAMVGSDTFVREGAALGMLFQAQNSTALGADLLRQRLEAKTARPDATEEKIELAGHAASYLSTPDGAIRSYYVADGDFHLVTTSRKLATRFLETAQDSSSLGKSRDFRHARTVMPLSRNDTIFIYLSDGLFRNLAGPHYRIEMARRMWSETELELASIAQLAAVAERQPGQTIEQLVAGGYLPASMTGRSDGSRLVFEKGQAYDSLRGQRGLFVPIPDVELAAVTPSEAHDFQQFSALFQTEWGAIDPVMIAVKRGPSKQSGLEHVTLDVKATPFAPQHFDRLSRWLGAPTDQRRAKIPGDLISAQAMMNDTTAGDYYVFAGLRDAPPQSAGPDNPLVGLLMGLQGLQGIQAYLGAWPQPGILGMLGAGSPQRPDANGYTRLLTGAWRLQVAQFTLLSFQAEVLREVMPQLRFEKAATPAQIFLTAEDLTKSRVAEIINGYGYRHERKASLGNTTFMHSLHEQLHVPADQTLAVAEAIMDAHLSCPLGGKYELVGTPNGVQAWVSSAVRNPAPMAGSRSAPDGYQFPALQWLRGVDLQVRMEKNLLSAHAELELPAASGAPSDSGGGIELPSISLPFKIPGFGSTPAPAPTPEALPPPKPTPPSTPKEF